MSSAPRRVPPQTPSRRGWCPSLARPMPTGDGLLARVHPPLGLLAVAQVRAVAEAARRFGNGHVDVTARGNLQIRGVTERTAPVLAAHLAAAGLGDVRADGGPQRLTLTSPLAGLDPDEAVDVPALAAAIERAGLAIPGLPAKTLVAIEGAGLGAAEADVILRPVSGGRVAVMLAGGEDGDAEPITVSEAAAASAVAMILRAFVASGARRIRDLSEPTRAAFLKGVVSDASAERSSPSRPDPEVPANAGLDGAFQKSRVRAEASFETRLRLTPQDEGCEVSSASRTPVSGRTAASTQIGVLPSAGAIPLGDGRGALAVEAPFGRCDAQTLDRLAGIAEQRAFGQPIRTSPNRGFVLVCETGGSAQDALLRLAAAGFVTEDSDPRRAVAACPGAPACASGSTATILDAGRLAQAFAPLAAAGLTAHVSGCAKGCARPGPADLTLVGMDGRYGVVLRGAPGALLAFELTFEAALERVRSAASTLSLDDAFRTTQ